jgi:hypothetical protein
MRRWSLAAFLLLVAAGCGGSKHAAGTTAATTAAPATTTTTATTAPATTQPAPPGALTGEARSAAAGDIPDNQVFVTYSGAAFSMKTPEGWARTGSAGKVTFRDKNNILRVVIAPAPAPTVAAVRRELATLAGAHVQTPPQAIKVAGVPAVKAVYSTKSAPNPVTGKSVTLIVDHYELGRNGKRAVIDLGSPAGVDNVDAYRLMNQSFKLR